MLCIERWSNPLILILRVAVAGVAVIIINNIDEKSKTNEWTSKMMYSNVIEVHPSVQTTTSSNSQSLTQLNSSHVKYLGDFL